MKILKPKKREENVRKLVQEYWELLEEDESLPRSHKQVSYPKTKN